MAEQDPVDKKYPKREYTDEELGEPLTKEEEEEQKDLEKQLEEQEKELRDIEKKIEEEVYKTNKELEELRKNREKRNVRSEIDIFEGMKPGQDRTSSPKDDNNKKINEDIF
ncbi:SWPV1-063 [Shearwaterpox virus]|uniref:SWPV1-063 n=1 Tax=Shearwaterpox virus TaxID=1974596 RepID=A0A1V0S7S2_CNPV|nr:SWPV1-063 [Shearwaterpox virus]